MNHAKESYKEWHPSQFSDSTVVKKARLGREFFEYYLSNISSHGLEKAFEHFCKSILEVEVCPNLITQTGPTGGGDSKVDTETYPVAEQLTESWLYGYGDKAGAERWAFAISSKADWQSKINSDVKKIVQTILEGRKYTRIFFVSNQRIPDKKRAAKEDELRSEYGVEVRILSMDWLLDAVFKNDINRMIAVKEFGLSESLVDEKRIGEKDYKRIRELEETEKTLRDLGSLKASEIIQAANKCLVLSRELEVDEQTIIGHIDRCNRLAKEYGTILDQADALYNSAHTLFWWYQSAKHFYDYYLKFEGVANEQRSTYLFERLCTLWMNLFSLVQQKELDDVDLGKHRETIEEIYSFLASDPDKPNTALNAKASFQMIRAARGDSVDDIVDDYIDIVKKGENSLEIDIHLIAEMIINVPFFQGAKKYDQLFDLLTDTLAKEKQNAEIAKMNMARGIQLYETDAYRSLAFFSKAVLNYYNEANSRLLMETVNLMAGLFEEIGLYWAARNYYSYVVSYGINEFMRTGNISLSFVIASTALKWVELMQGRVVFSTQMHTIESIAREAYPGPVPEYNNDYDLILAYPIFQTSFEKLKKLGRFPQYLEAKGLPMASLACDYELGYYDETLMKECNESKEEFDQHMKMWANQPAWDQIRFAPWYGFENNIVLQSRIMGCLFRIFSENDMFAIEFGSTLLATLECFLGTGFHNGLISRASSFEIEVHKSQKQGFYVDVDYNRDNPTHMTVFVSEYENSEFLASYKALPDKLIEIVSIIIASVLVSNEDFQKLKEMVENESIIARTEVFADSLFNGYTTFGQTMFSYSDVTKDYEEKPLIRRHKVELHKDDKAVSDGTTKSGEIIFGIPTDFDYDQVKNHEIIMSDIINAPLWDVSSWRGVQFSFSPLYNMPILSLVFENESCLRIFDEWITKLGAEDKDDIIGIRIIKQIDSNNPFWYRVGIGTNSFIPSQAENYNRVIINPVRMQTMQPRSDVNLSTFERMQSRSGVFLLCPSILKSKDTQPQEHYERRILKHNGCLRIINAHEITKKDMLSVISMLPTDHPYIPAELETCELLEIMEHRRKMMHN